MSVWGVWDGKVQRPGGEGYSSGGGYLGNGELVWAGRRKASDHEKMRRSAGQETYSGGKKN